MEPVHWDRVKEIFAEALEQAPASREAFVREACGGNDAILQAVLKLLAGHSRAGGNLSQPVFPMAFSEDSDRPPRFSALMVIAGRFQIIRLIARGGMGEVYEADDLQLGVRVALKTIRPDIAADKRVLELFKNEIQTARRVTHPNVCRIYDFAQHSEPASGGRDDTTFFLTMELLAGQSLSEHLKLHGAFSFEAALTLIGQLASALQAAHEAGVVHRDFKPGNVMLVPDGDGKLRAIVTDFGLAVVRTQTASQPLPDAAGGTPAYMAPEQLNGGEITPATDVYALGLVIAEMAGGRIQPVSPSRLQTSSRLREAHTGVNLSLPETHRRWEPILLRCLEADPAKRYYSAAQVVEALGAVSSPGSMFIRTRKSLTVVSILLVAALGLTAFVAQRFRQWPIPDPVTKRMLGPEDDVVGIWRPSPDGRYFAITDWNTGNLGLRDIRTGEIRLLIHKSKSPSEGQVLSAVFSPGGGRIAYSWLQDGVCEIRINDTETGADTLLYRNPAIAYCEAVDWSPDGSRILALLEPGDSGTIAVISVQDHSVTLPVPVGLYGNAVFAPDGRHVIFNAPQKNLGIESDVFEVALNGGPVAALIQDQADDRIIGFSRDGRRMIFSSDRSGTLGVWSIAFYGGTTEGKPSVLTDLGRAGVIGMTRDGELYFSAVKNSLDVYTAEIDVSLGRLISNPKNVVKRYRGSFLYSGWSADGSQMSFVSNLDPRKQIWIYTPSSGEIRRLEPKLANFNRPQWDPSGNRIFVIGTNSGGRRGIFRIDAVTGAAEMAIDNQTLRGNEGTWARDGHTLYDRSSDPKQSLFRIDSQTGQRNVFYTPPAGLDLSPENLTLSPDQSTLAFQARTKSTGTSSLMVIPVGGGTARTLLTIANPEQFPFGSFAWTADSTQILAVRTRDNVSELWLVPVDGGDARKVDFPSMRITQLRMNPDGRTISFTSGESSSEIWVAENLFPR